VTEARRAAVFLDRDGVLNVAPVRDGRPHPPATVDELRLLPGVGEACRKMKEAGLVLVVVTNQPDVARGATDVARVDAINDALRARLPIDEIAVCPHDDADHCSCRKPKPGLLVESATRWHVDLAASVLVGDRWRDVEAGRAAGTVTVFVDRGYDEARPVKPDLVVSELMDAVPFILEWTKDRRPSA
jgi:D-glycero-D-manno-heptose 1,7-bisphosphate phosphatase